MVEFRTVNIPKFASFFANELIGQPYGLTYEINNKKLGYMAPRTLDELGALPYISFRLALLMVV